MRDDYLDCLQWMTRPGSGLRRRKMAVRTHGFLPSTVSARARVLAHVTPSVALDQPDGRESRDVIFLRCDDAGT